MHRTRTIAAAVAALLVLSIGPAVASSTSLPGDLGTTTPSLDALVLPGLSHLAGSPDITTGIASLDAVPSAVVVASLERLGLEVQPMRHLPLVIVRGPGDAMRAAVAAGLADDVYPDEPIQLFDTASSDAMGGATTRAAGLTGKGATVAVVDSGCDASHPDLADHVTHNVKLVSAEYANVTPDSSNTIVVPIEEGPYQNTDVGSGHGTHVAGIIAADGTTSPDHLGVAPDAELVCLSIGEVLFTTAVVTAYDFLLDQPDLWGVDVVNNSWGNLYAQFDPRNPVAVATKAVADDGVTVVFAAGNSGDGNGEGTLNPFSQSPWVISVAAETVDHVRGSFSSNGLRFDNSLPTAVGAGGLTTFTGERIGLVHPDVAGPGVDISSSCDTLGTAVGPCPPGENTVASGTSMASPHVAGAAAVLEQANPNLTPAQVRQVLQTTATPVRAVDDAGVALTAPAPFWQVGYGRVDLAAAVRAARSAKALRDLDRSQATRDQQVLTATGLSVLRSDFAVWDAPRLSLGTDVRSFEIPRDSKATKLKVTVVFPSEATVGVDLGLTQYSAVVEDAAGHVVVAQLERVGIGAAGALVTLPAGLVGSYTVTVTGDRSVSDPDTLDSDSVLNDTVTFQVAQLRAR
jgi:serine protease AprX